jgi:hypothetical protein
MYTDNDARLVVVAWSIVQQDVCVVRHINFEPHIPLRGGTENLRSPEENNCTHLIRKRLLHFSIK